MQLRLDAADRLVELVEEHRRPVPADEAAKALFALARSPVGLARTLLGEIVEADARLAWRGSSVALASGFAFDVPLEAATFVVVDLETTGLTPTSARICEIGAVRLRALEPAGTFETFVDPGRPLPPATASLTGIRDDMLRRAPRVETAVRRFLAFAGESVLVAHNARFDLAFLDRVVERALGRRIAAPVVDTAALGRRLLAGRARRFDLGSLAHFFGTSATPCHRALPDAQATAEILVALVGLAQERGAATAADVCALAAPRARAAHAKRSLAFGAPKQPGVYLFRGQGDEVLYVGRARDLRARLRSYFRSERQRPALEAALAALERVEWRVAGSELEAALEELALIRELRPPANARGLRPDRYVYLERCEDTIRVSSTPTELGPVRSRRRAELAARALSGASPSELDRLRAGGPLPRLRARLRELSDARRYEDAARLRDRLLALERVVAELRELERLRAAELCLLAPARDERFVQAFFVSGGVVASRRRVPRAGGALVEIAAGLSEARRKRSEGATYAPEAADDLLLVGSFLRRPPPELAVLPLDPERIVAACERGIPRVA